MREIDVVDELASGVLESPQRWCGQFYVVLRISSTGCAWRAAKNELCWRDPRTWLSPTMCARWTGAPVILTHPKNGVLDTESFVNTTVGSIVRAFVRGEELLGVARILDGDVAEMRASPGALRPPGHRETWRLGSENGRARS
jgi:hypothetical protein